MTKMSATMSGCITIKKNASLFVPRTRCLLTDYKRKNSTLNFHPRPFLISFDDLHRRSAPPLPILLAENHRSLAHAASMIYIFDFKMSK